jgi:hypothetical protein
VTRTAILFISPREPDHLLFDGRVTHRTDLSVETFSYSSRRPRLRLCAILCKVAYVPLHVRKESHIREQELRISSAAPLLHSVDALIRASILCLTSRQRFQPFPARSLVLPSEKPSLRPLSLNGQGALDWIPRTISYVRRARGSGFVDAAALRENRIIGIFHACLGMFGCNACGKETIALVW